MKYQIVIAGVGGQGVLFGAKIFMELARQRGLRVLGSENHGMSQRGGSVTSHLRIGNFHGPLVAEGDADLLLGLDALEAHRSLPFLRAADDGPGALCLISIPRSAVFPDPRVAPVLRRMDVHIHTCEADAVAMALGNALAANLVLLGFGARFPRFPFAYDELCTAVETLSARERRAANLAALARGNSLPDLAAAEQPALSLSPP